MSQPNDHPLRILLLVRRLRGSPDGGAAGEVLGECERAALTAALTLRDELGAHVTVAAMGPARREDRVLAMALRAGCDAAVRVYDRGLQGLDYLGVAHVLAAAANHLGFDVILCGDRSQDERQGAVGPAVAELLEVPHLSSAITDLRADDQGLIATRRAGGRIQSLRVTTPAVVAVARFTRLQRPGPDEPDDDAALDDKPTPARPPPARIADLDLGDLGLSSRELRYRAQYLGRARALRTPRQPLLLPTATDLIARLREDHLLE